MKIRVFQFAISFLLLIAISCTSEKKKIIYESHANKRYPGKTLKWTNNEYYDSIKIKVHNTVFPLYFMWDSFSDTTFNCYKPGNIKIYTDADNNAIIKDFILTPLPCSTNWDSTSVDNTIFEKILVSAYFEVKEDKNTHSLTGNFCIVDGKGNLRNLLNNQ